MSTRTKEYVWALVASVLILAFGSAPLIAGYAAQTPDQRYIGAYFDQQDYAVHLAAMHYGEQGNWMYQMRFTSEPTSPVFQRIFYVLLGHVDRWTGLPAATVFEAARLLFGLLACLAVYRLLRRVFPSINQRRLAFVLAILGSGLGWWQLLTQSMPSKVSPIDFWLIDAYILFSINLFPHFSAVIAALAIAITAFLDYSRQPRWHNILMIAACAIFTQVVNPLAFLLADLALAGIFVFSSWQERKMNFRLALALGLIAIIQVPLLLYALFVFTRDPAWALFNSQNSTPSPPLLYYLFGFGLFWPFTLAGMIKTLREREPALGWALVWAIFAFGLAYLPIGTQRRFLLAVTIPLAALATTPLSDFSRWLGRRLRLNVYSGAILVTALACISSILLVANYSLNIYRPPSALYEPAALVRAVDWLGQHGTPDDVVLATEPISQLVAMRTFLRLYSGHEMETLHYAEKALAVRRFYSGEQAAGWLPDAQNITWVIFAPHETGWLQMQLPGKAEVAYQNNLVRIYRITHP